MMHVLKKGGKKMFFFYLEMLNLIYFFKCYIITLLSDCNLVFWLHIIFVRANNFCALIIKGHPELPTRSPNLNAEMLMILNVSPQVRFLLAV